MHGCRISPWRMRGPKRKVNTFSSGLFINFFFLRFLKVDRMTGTDRQTDKNKPPSGDTTVLYTDNKIVNYTQGVIAKGLNCLTLS